jgi:alpha-beta hydrolase superfamily lysophospholipase
MDIAAALELYGLNQNELAFRGSFRGQHFMDNWLSVTALASGGWRLTSTSWVDGRVLGGPLPPQIAELELTIDQKGTPLRALRTSLGKTLTVDFRGGWAILPDDSHQPVETADVQHVLENNHPSLLALFGTLAPPTTGGQVRKAFIVSALSGVPYRLAPQEDGAFLSEFGETLRFDAAGRLVGIEAADGAVMILRADPAPPRPIAATEAVTPVYVARATLAPRMQDIAVDAAARGMLAATFTSPAYPTAAGVLVLQGSGDVDRHGFSAGLDTGTATFADTLAELGLAVLKYDKRGVGQSRRADDSLPSEGFQGTLDDANAALTALRARLASGTRLILLGHSLGGLAALALSVERHHGELPLVLLAAPGRPLSEVIRAQTLDQGRRLGMSEAALDRQLEDLEHFFAYARGEISGDNVRAFALAGRLAKPFMADLAALDPAALMRRQTAPVCLLQGGRDVQVDPSLDFERLRQAGEQVGVPLQARLFPTLNHLFRQVEPSEGLESYALAGSVDPEAVTFVVDWFRGQGFAA